MLLNPCGPSSSSVPTDQPKKDRQKLYGTRRSCSTSAVQGVQGRLTPHCETFPRTGTHTGLLVQPNDSSSAPLWSEDISTTQTWNSEGSVAMDHCGLMGWSRGTSGGGWASTHCPGNQEDDGKGYSMLVCTGAASGAGIRQQMWTLWRCLWCNSSARSRTYIPGGIPPHPRTYTYWIVCF